MRKEYDFSKGRRNPYARRLKRPVTIRIDQSTIKYFQDLAAELEVPYQTLIKLYLRESAARCSDVRRSRRSDKGDVQEAPDHRLDTGLLPWVYAYAGRRV